MSVMHEREVGRDDGGGIAAAPPPAAPPAGLPAAVRDDWVSLASPPPPLERFDPESTAGLPVAAERWLRHAIDPGAPLATAVELTMRGEIRIGSWQSFSARQVLAPGRGSIWAASVGPTVMRTRGFDRYTRGSGEMRWRLYGLIPVMSAAGEDVTRSAAGRLAGELVFCPTAALTPDVGWSGSDERSAVAEITIADRAHRVTLEVDEAGMLRSAVLPRWGDAGGGDYRERSFRVAFEGERRFGPYTIPSVLRAGWTELGEDGWPEDEFFRATIDSASFR
jgi:hypothetical protein